MPVWSRPQNGVVETGSVIGGPTSWPALSESTRPISRSSSDASRPIVDGSASLPQAPIIPQPPQRQANTSSHTNSTANNTTRPRSRTRGGGGGGGGSSSGGGGPSHNNFNRPPPPTPPPFPIFEAYGTGTRPVRGQSHHTGNDQSSQRNNSTSRRGNYGPRPRGDGQYNHHGGGRRDQDRRDVRLPPQYNMPPPPPLGYMPPPLPPGAAPPFMAPPPVRVFPGQMGFGDMVSTMYYVPTMPPEPFRAMPIIPPPPPVHFPPVNENSLTNMIVKQIDYYFSDENLVKDNYLRTNMDDHGWVPISLIANFPRVQQLTQDIPLILDSLRYSTIVEVQGDKVRRCNEWNKWLHPPGWMNNVSAAQNPGNVATTSSHDESVSNSNGNMHTRDTVMGTNGEESTGQSTLANGDDNAEESVAHS